MSRGAGFLGSKSADLRTKIDKNRKKIEADFEAYLLMIKEL
jgi:hypothetical protein